MPKWTTVILLAVALIACTSAQPSEDRQTGKGKKPVKATEGNKGNPPAGATPPPLKGNKEPGDARQGPVKVDRSGTKEEKKYVMSSGGFNVETNGEGGGANDSSQLILPSKFYTSPTQITHVPPQDKHLYCRCDVHLPPSGISRRLHLPPLAHRTNRALF
jgi:hypothetical protein